MSSKTILLTFTVLQNLIWIQWKKCWLLIIKRQIMLWVFLNHINGFVSTFAALLLLASVSIIYKKQTTETSKTYFHTNLTAVKSPKKTQHVGKRDLTNKFANFWMLPQITSPHLQRLACHLLSAFDLFFFSSYLCFCFTTLFQGTGIRPLVLLGIKTD